MTLPTNAGEWDSRDDRTRGSVRTLGAITPVGGLAFILGWLALACVVWSGRP